MERRAMRKKKYLQTHLKYSEIVHHNKKQWSEAVYINKADALLVGRCRFDAITAVVSSGH